MRRTPNRWIWLIAAAAVIVFGLWQQRAGEQAAGEVGAVRQAAREKAPAPQPGAPLETARPSRIESLVPDAAERAAVLATIERIERGGPYPYPKDGTVFGNRERRLPERPRGWYREYTVPTPGSRDRGARRIVRGRDGETFYTRDHYGSFLRLDE